MFYFCCAMEQDSSEMYMNLKKAAGNRVLFFSNECTKSHPRFPLLGFRSHLLLEFSPRTKQAEQVWLLNGEILALLICPSKLGHKKNSESEAGMSLKSGRGTLWHWCWWTSSVLMSQAAGAGEDPVAGVVLASAQAQPQALRLTQA